MSDFDITGGEQLARLSKALKDAGRKKLRAKLTKTVKASAAVVTEDSRAEARKRLPKRGGLSELVAGAPQKVQIRTTGSQVGARVVIPGKHSGAAATDIGKVRHPVFGNREVWREQDVPPGWFSDTVKKDGPKVRAAIEADVQAVMDEIAREAT